MAALREENVQQKENSPPKNSFAARRLRVVLSCFVPPREILDTSFYRRYATYGTYGTRYKYHGNGSWYHGTYGTTADMTLYDCDTKRLVEETNITLLTGRKGQCNVQLVVVSVTGLERHELLTRAIQNQFVQSPFSGTFYLVRHSVLYLHR